MIFDTHAHYDDDAFLADREEVLEFWSSGSTTMYGLKGAGKQAAAEHEA